jgi:hypothetical protein
MGLIWKMAITGWGDWRENREISITNDKTSG